MVRVLHVLGGLGSGGTESLIMNWFLNIDRNKIQFDFLVRSSDNNYAQEIAALGGRIFYTPSFPRHCIGNYAQTKEILRRKEWDVIHVHGNAAMYMLPLKLAKQLGYPCRIMHSHSIQARNPLFSQVHFLNRRKIEAYATHKLACSEAAGRWMYGSENFLVLKNAIETEKYLLSHSVREAYRKALAVEDKLVVGHVGRFAMSKNHIFLLDVFYEIKKQHNNSVLMLVGDGELETEIKAKAAQLGILDSVLFMGRRSDVGKLMSAMDMFVLPSLYEGLGIVLVEAQFSGLPCVVSEEAFHKEVEITSNISRISLKDSAAVWADRMLEISHNTVDRHMDDARIQDSGYDIKTEVAKLEALYLRASKGNEH